MKRIIAFLLMLMMILGCASCAKAPEKSDSEFVEIFGGDNAGSENTEAENEEDDKTSSKDEDEDDEEEITSSEDDEKEEKPSSKDEEEEPAVNDVEDDKTTVKDDDEETTADEDEQTIAISGTITGDVYESEFSGLKFTKPSTWQYSSKEDLFELMDIGADALNMEISDYQKALMELTLVYDMMAASPTTGDNIQIMYEKLSATGSSSITIDQYLDNVTQGLSALGYTANIIGDATISGMTYKAATAEIDLDGTKITQIYYARKVGDYMNCIVATLVSMSKADIEAMFS